MGEDGKLGTGFCHCAQQIGSIGSTPTQVMYYCSEGCEMGFDEIPSPEEEEEEEDAVEVEENLVEEEEEEDLEEVEVGMHHICDACGDAFDCVGGGPVCRCENQLAGSSPRRIIYY